MTNSAFENLSTFYTGWLGVWKRLAIALENWMMAVAEA